MVVRILVGDAVARLRELPYESVHCAVSSPPYFNLRSYLADDDPLKAMELGLERTPEEYIAGMVDVFREVRRVLRSDGTLWLNLSDSYAGSGRGGNPPDSQHTKQRTNRGSTTVDDYLHASLVEAGAIGRKWTKPPEGMRRKNLIGIPWRVAFALQADGWNLRQWLPWLKRSAMPESTKDRPTSACETVFMLTKSEVAYFDYETVKRPMAMASEARLAQDIEAQAGSLRANGGGKTNGAMKAVRGDKQRDHSRRHAGFNERWERQKQRGERAFRNSDLFYDSLSAPHGAIGNDEGIIALDVATQGFKAAHFATFPSRLIEPLIKASCPEGGVVLDPFGGAGTTGLVADRLGRDAILIDLNPEYAEMAAERIRGDAAMLADVTVERIA